MEIAWYIYPLALLAGVAAGVINTLAGSGSLLTLPMLVFLGLPANVANATNRIGVFFQNIVGIGAFRRAGNLNARGWVWLTAPAVVGSLIGAYVATRLDADQMNTALGVMMVFMLLLILFDPKRWLRVQSELADGRPSFIVLGVFFLIGIYGGFIQAGVGILLLSAMVLGMGYNLVEGNAVKLVIVLAFTATSILIFSASGQINWGMGILMAVGQSVGAWLAAHFASRAKNANTYIRWLIIVVIVVSILKFFGLPPF